MKKYKFLILSLFFCACTSSNIANSHSNSDSISLAPKQDSIVQKSQTETKNSDLTLFGNMEMYPYCVLLPLESYKPEISEKMHHTFTLKSKSSQSDFIKLQGFHIDEDKNFKPQVFYERDKQEIEESGLGIDTSYLDVSKNLYLIKGYLPNLPDQKFMRLVWVKDFELVLEVAYTAEDRAIWEERIQQIMKKGMNCE